MRTHTDADIDRAAHVASALDSPLRLRILLLLSSGEHVVHQLVTKLDKSQPLISQHLRVLKRAGLVTCSRRGREVRYSIARPEVLDVICGLMDIAENKGEVIDLASRRPTGDDSPITGGAVAIIEPPDHVRPDVDPGLNPSLPKPKRS
ncbi:ArsR/SmtB family transcription factor [Corynebacterium sp. UBA2622]|uniref:ArsR/SmtB family transcription factor n=1 Tax=Corynebacterium sp. UBA2622 TaxID=1946393 RepID=UPI0025C48831|nr:metalloregulator ArsR/SmtB family transcription factor [Corynebacterium sp. UBA2622]